MSTTSDITSNYHQMTLNILNNLYNLKMEKFNKELIGEQTQKCDAVETYLKMCLLFSEKS